MSSYPIENLLRPALEWRPALITGILGILFIKYPAKFLLTPLYSQILGLGLIGLSILRFKQGYSIKRYHQFLKRLPRYEIHSKQIPVSKKKLFLGKGFQWQVKHTQRLYFCQQPFAQKYLKPSSFYLFARWIENKFEKKALLKPIIKLLSADHFLKPCPAFTARWRQSRFIWCRTQ